MGHLDFVRVAVILDVIVSGIFFIATVMFAQPQLLSRLRQFLVVLVGVGVVGLTFELQDFVVHLVGVFVLLTRVHFDSIMLFVL